MHLVIETPEAPAAIGPYSQGIVAGELVFVSGQLGLDPKSGDFKGPDLTTQTRQALANIKAVLKAAKCDLHHVVSVDAFLVDMDDFAAFNAVYKEYFTDHRPARAVVAVKTLPKNARVEIKCMAVCRP